MNIPIIDAISLIEEAGGFVMMPDEDQDLSQFDKLIEKEAFEKVELEEFQKKRKEALANLSEDFHNLIGKPDFSFSDAENLCLYHGCDVDEIETMLFNEF